MPDTIKAAADTADFDAVRADLDALRRDVARLVDRVRYDATDEVRRLYGQLAAEGERQTEMLSRRVEARPLTAVLLAFGLGILGGRLFLR